MRKIMDQRGSVGSFITILIIVIIFYAGFKLAAPYYRAYSMKIDTGSIMSRELSQEEMQQKIYQTAIDDKIPLDIKNLIVTKEPDNPRVTVEMKWDDIIDIFGHPVYKITRNINLIK
ncbi:MAG: hypothetical protein HQK91_06195 [Nitrospirae bacterium]|nr:hypothetical protein [Nitrospirota bacterium]